MTDARAIEVTFSPHAYWSDQPHAMRRPASCATIFATTPRDAIDRILASLGKLAHEVLIAKAHVGEAAVATLTKPPIPLAYIESGMTRAQASAGLSILLREQG